MLMLPTQPEKTKENYEKFLESDFWKELSRRKRKKVGKCEECGSRKRLQCHHKEYPDHWWRTTERMLEVLCRSCHEARHGIVHEWNLNDSTIPERAFTAPAPPSKSEVAFAMRRIMELRGSGRMSRQEFVKRRNEIRQGINVVMKPKVVKPFRKTLAADWQNAYRVGFRREGNFVSVGDRKIYSP